VHLLNRRYNLVIETFDYAGLSRVDDILSNKINILIKRLKIRQIVEGGQKQGKIPSPRMFCAELSPETVDSFSLATG
jgi:hypothetical protein